MFDSGFFPDVAKPGSFLADTLYLVKGNGISLKPSTALSVVPKTGLTVTVKAGRGMFNGYPFNLTSDVDITLTATASPQTIYIGVRLVKDAYGVPTGYSGNNAIAMTSFVSSTDMAFGSVTLAANATTIVLDDISDLRFQSAYCGVIDQYDVMLAALAAAYQAGLDAMNAGGIPTHGNSHKYGGSDALPPANIGQYGVVEKDANGVVAAAATALVIRDVTANDSLVSADFGKNIRVNSASAVTITIPSGLPTGFYCFVTRKGAGAVTIAAGSGVTLNAAGSRYKIAEQQGRVAIDYDGASNTYLLVGNFIA